MAAASVPEVLTTTRSPGDRNVPRSVKRACSMPPGRATSSRTPSRVGGGAVASRPAGQFERGGHRLASGRRQPRPTRRRGSARRRPGIEQPEQRRDHGRGLRPVADVLAGEGGLVHVGAHVAGVHGIDAKVGLLGGEDGAELVEGGLGRPVAAPARVGLDGRVGADVQHDPAGRAQPRRQQPGPGPAARRRRSRRPGAARRADSGRARAAGWVPGRWRCSPAGRAGRAGRRRRRGRRDARGR